MQGETWGKIDVTAAFAGCLLCSQPCWWRERSLQPPPVTQQELCKAGWCCQNLGFGQDQHCALWGTTGSVFSPSTFQPGGNCSPRTFHQATTQKYLGLGVEFFVTPGAECINKAGAVIVMSSVSITPAAAASCPCFLEPGWFSSLLIILNNFGEVLVEFSWNNHNYGADFSVPWKRCL